MYSYFYISTFQISISLAQIEVTPSNRKHVEELYQIKSKFDKLKGQVDLFRANTYSNDYKILLDKFDNLLQSLYTLRGETSTCTADVIRVSQEVIETIQPYISTLKTKAKKVCTYCTMV